IGPSESRLATRGARPDAFWAIARLASIVSAPPVPSPVTTCRTVRAPLFSVILFLRILNFSMRRTGAVAALRSGDLHDRQCPERRSGTGVAIYSHPRGPDYRPVRG